jgi:Tol biopolymer transport system component
VLPLDRALGQFTADALLYVDSKGFLTLTDGQRKLWLTSDDTVCDHDVSYFREGGEWSPDGRSIAISCSYEKMAVVALLDTRTGALRRVDTGASDTSPVVAWAGAWSPDGRTFLILTRSEDRSRLSVVDALTGRVETQNLFEDQSLTLYTAWSPDGTRIAIYTGNGLHGSRGSSKLYLVNADGSNLHLLTEDVGSFDQCGLLEWSHDGRFIFVKIDDGSYCIRIAAGTGFQESVAYDPQIPTTVRWSPDGRWYLVKQQPQWLLYRADGTLVRRFEAGTNREFSVAAWLPDSRRIVMGINEVISSTAEVILADVEGRQTVLATYPHARVGTLAVAPDTDLLAVPLGSQIVILDSQGQVRADVEGQLSGWWPRR